MIRFATKWEIAAAVALGLMFASCKPEAEAKDSDGNTQFELAAPSDQTINAGTTNQVRISIDRKNYQGQVDIAIEGLPSGVKLLNPAPLAAGQNDRDYSLEAVMDAPAVDNKVCTVRAKGGGAEITQQFKITVKPKS